MKYIHNQTINPTPVSVAALRGLFQGVAGYQKRYAREFVK